MNARAASVKSRSDRSNAPAKGAAREPITVLIVVAEPRRRAPPTPARSNSCAFSLPPATRRSWCRAAAAWFADVTAAGGEFVALDVASNNPARHAAQRDRAHAARARAPLRRDPCARPRARLERLLRRAPHRRAVPDQLVQGLPRAEQAQAPLQQRDGARRPRHRGRATRSPISSTTATARRGSASRWCRAASTSSSSTRRRSRPSASRRCAAPGASSTTPR